MSRLKNVTVILLIVVTLGVTLAGCNRTRTRLPGVWKRERLKVSNNPVEYWIFEDNKIRISPNKNGIPTVALSDYLATDRKIVFSTFSTFKEYNGKWRIIDIDDNILRIACFDNGGMLTREFTKVE